MHGKKGRKRAFAVLLRSRKTQIFEDEEGNNSINFAIRLMIRLKELSADVVLVSFWLQLYQYM